MSSVKNTIVAAIDFGTTYSGYVFSLGIDQTKFYFPPKWAAGHGEQIFFKTPTSLLLNPDQTFNSFGYEAEDKEQGTFCTKIGPVPKSNEDISE